jgi:hypothetical protein
LRCQVILALFNRALPLSFALGLVVAVALPAGAMAGVSSEQAVAYLNQQRAANGIPDVVNDPNLAIGCQRHNQYMEATGIFGHGEDPASPYYTPEGAGESPYGGAEVLSSGRGYDPAVEVLGAPVAGTAHNPWEWAPIHLFLMLAPWRTGAGYDKSHDFACMRLKGYVPYGSASDKDDVQFFSYPANGTSGIYPAQRAAERPYTPQELVGIPSGQITGTNILLFSRGVDKIYASSHSLAGPGGDIPSHLVDRNTKNNIGSGSWFNGGGVLIPTQPLVEFSPYTATINWRGYREGEWQDFTQQFSFTTGKAVEWLGEKEISGKNRKTRLRVRHPKLRLRRVGRGPRLVRVRLTASRALVKRKGRVFVVRKQRRCFRAYVPAAGRHFRTCGWRKIGKQGKRSMRLRRSQVIRVRAPQERQLLIISAKTRGFKDGEHRFSRARARMVIK